MAASAHIVSFPIVPALLSSGSSPRFLHRSFRPLAWSHGRAPPVLEQESRHLRLPYPLKEGQTRFFHPLPSGLSMEVISQKAHDVLDCRESPGGGSSSPPLVFVHGSFHAAWCWAEHWLPFFSAAGYDCYAISLIGQVLLRNLILLFYYQRQLCMRPS